MLQRQCLNQPGLTLPFILVVHAESEEKIKETVEQTFGEKSLLHSKSFQI